MVTRRHVVGVMAGGLGGGEAGRDGGAAVIAAAEGLDWNAWSELESGAQVAQGEGPMLTGTRLLEQDHRQCKEHVDLTRDNRRLQAEGLLLLRRSWPGADCHDQTCRVTEVRSPVCPSCRHRCHRITGSTHSSGYRHRCYTLGSGPGGRGRCPELERHAGVVSIVFPVPMHHALS